MKANRMEAYSDAVIAIVITIMVLKLSPPVGASLEALSPLLPTFLSYVLSFAFLSIYWSNHHHMLQATSGVNVRILWTNIHLLFWLSLVPFTTSWMSEQVGETLPAVLYGVNLLMAAVAYNLLAQAIVAREGANSMVAEVIGTGEKGNWSMLLYATSIVLAFVNPLFSYIIFTAVALLWLVPDRRAEHIAGGDR